MIKAVEAIFGFLGKMADWGRETSDPDNREIKYHQKRRKMNNKAKDIAEQEFFLVGQYINNNINKKRLANEHKKLHKAFFEHN